MRITEKLWMNKDELERNGPITIVAFGDSVTHGAVGPDEINYETVFWNRLRQKMLNVRNYVPINVINAGIGGVTATLSLSRMEAQVFSHHPDLVIVCFGLNDINDPLEQFLSAIKAIFARGIDSGSDIIFMTPNMLNTYVAEDTEAQYRNYAAITAEYQNNGRMDSYMRAAVETARSMGIPVCDCYAQWKKISETTDTTQLLANRINHPTAQMHELFAEELFRIIFSHENSKKILANVLCDSTMYLGNTQK